LLQRVAHWVTDGRARVLSLLALATVLLATQIPNVEIDSAPENLLSSYEGNDQSVADRFHDSFGDTDRVVVVLLQADDVLTATPLTYMRALSSHFADDPAVERVDDITRLPLPSVAARPSMTSVAARPSMTSVAARPSMTSVAARPSMTSVAAKRMKPGETTSRTTPWTPFSI